VGFLLITNIRSEFKRLQRLSLQEPVSHRFQVLSKGRNAAEIPGHGNEERFRDKSAIQYGFVLMSIRLNSFLDSRNLLNHLPQFSPNLLPIALPLKVAPEGELTFLSAPDKAYVFTPVKVS
jgi:hypothetical protein